MVRLVHLVLIVLAVLAIAVADVFLKRAAIEELNARDPDFTPHLSEFNITSGNKRT